MSNNIAYYRTKLKNWNQTKLSNQIGVSRSLVAMWETGSVVPKTDQIQTLCEIFKCTEAELFPIHDDAPLPEIPTKDDIKIRIIEGSPAALKQAGLI